MIYSSKPNLTFKIISWILSYTVFWIFFFLILNTSFSIMGVEVGEYLKQYASAFFGIALLAFLKVFLTFFAFNLGFGSFIFFSLNQIFPNLKSRMGLVYSLGILQVTQGIALFHSWVQFPQLYGEFFFYRYLELTPVLYFFTDFIPPYFFSLLLWVPYIFILFSLGFQGLYKKIIQARLLLFAWVLVCFIHQGGSLLFLCLFGLSSVYLLQKDLTRLPKHLEKGLWGILPLGFLFLNSAWFVSFLPRDSKQINVFLISTDSLRYDKLGFISGNKEISPHLDEFAKTAILFHDHHTTVPRTFPSWADLMTGKYSMSHKVRDMFPSPDEKSNIGSGKFPTIAQKLREKGFSSAVIGSFAGDIFPRANFGFDKTYAPDFNARIMTIQRTMESQLLLLPILTGSYLFGGCYLEEVKGLSTWGDGERLVQTFKNTLNSFGNSSLFLTYFSSVVHFPYTPAYPHYKKFTNPNYYGKYKYLKFVDPLTSEKPNATEIQQIRGLFDSAIFAFDLEFGALIKLLKDKDIYDSSIIIVTADHGEALYEDIHGQGHGEHLRGEAVTKVPLMIKLPKALESDFSSVGDIRVPTSSIDIFPTLMNLFQVDYDRKSYPGVSLLDLAKNPKAFQDRAVYSETGIWFSDRGDQFFQKQRIPYPNILELHNVIPEEDYQIMITDPVFRETISFAKHRALLTSKYKLIYIPTREGVNWELYDRIEDPMNTRNLYPKPEVSNKLKENLYDLVRKWERANVVGEFLMPSNSSDF